MEKKKNIYLKKQNTCLKKKRKHVCFLLFVLGIFMLPLLLMCQCCGRDLHLATHATILWCCPRMYQHEIKKKHLVIFLYIFPEEKAVWYSCLAHRKLFHLNGLEIFHLIHSSSHMDVHQNNEISVLFWICRIS